MLWIRHSHPLRQNSIHYFITFSLQFLPKQQSTWTKLQEHWLLCKTRGQSYEYLYTFGQINKCILKLEHNSISISKYLFNPQIIEYTRHSFKMRGTLHVLVGTGLRTRPIQELWSTFRPDWWSGSGLVNFSRFC